MSDVPDSALGGSRLCVPPAQTPPPPFCIYRNQTGSAKKNSRKKEKELLGAAVVCDGSLFLTPALFLCFYLFRLCHRHQEKGAPKTVSLSLFFFCALTDKSDGFGAPWKDKRGAHTKAKARWVVAFFSPFLFFFKIYLARPSRERAGLFARVRKENRAKRRTKEGKKKSDADRGSAR